MADEFKIIDVYIVYFSLAEKAYIKTSPLLFRETDLFLLYLLSYAEFINGSKVIFLALS